MSDATRLVSIVTPICDQSQLIAQATLLIKNRDFQEFSTYEHGETAELHLHKGVLSQVGHGFEAKN